MTSNELTDETLSEQLKTERELSGMTQQQLAKKAGVSQRYISKLEQATPKKSLNALMRVVDALGGKIKIVFGDE